MSLFQFHYGSVKSEVVKKKYVLMCLFQFHYGSVKRLVTPTQREAHVLFQFHYGSVKRLECSKRQRCSCYFNSTMVRLKDCLHIQL